LGQRLGQHFLIAPTVLKRIAQTVCPQPEPVVLEIGPGKGALTEHLIPLAQRLILIELDPELAASLKERYQSNPNIQVIHSDVLQVDLAQWGPLVIAGNLPYYITSPIIEKVLNLGSLCRRAVFLVQREVADRLLAKPKSRDYGFLSVRTQLLADAKKVIHVSRGAFQPPPKVESTVVALTPVSPAIDNTEAFLKFAAACFLHKRKNLRNNLQPMFPGTDFPESRLRAEELSLPELIALYRRLQP
jgi:16S rRNA (adenine1518-N6/adenine1519-N6)-dimethyltransferase